LGILHNGSMPIVHINMINNKTLEYIITLARTGSMTKAASELYVSQSSLSQFLKNEEINQGQKLFIREKGVYTPTKAGKIYIDYAEKIIALTDEFNEQMLALKEKYTLQIGTTTSVAVDILDKMRKKSPNSFSHIDIKIINCSNIGNAIYGINNGNLDLALITSPYEDFSSGNRMLLSKEKILLGIPDAMLDSITDLQNFKKTRKKSNDCYPQISETDIHRYFRNLPFILQHKGSCLRYIIDEYFTESDFVARTSGNADNTSSLISMIQENMGIGFVPEFNSYDVSKISFYEPTPNLYRCHMVYIRKDLSHDPIVQNFIELLKRGYSNYFSSHK